MDLSSRKTRVLNLFGLCKYSAYFMIIFLLTLAAFDCLEAQAFQSEDSDSSVVWGQVIDAVTGQPIENATITFWKYRSRQRYPSLEKVVTIGVNGSYKISLEGGYSYDVYAYHENPNSPGRDYLPKLKTTHLDKEEEANIIFELVPSASIILEGDILFISKPLERYDFTVVPEKELPKISGSILTYGSYDKFINVNSTHIIVPANSPLKIEVKVRTKSFSREYETYTFGMERARARCSTVLPSLFTSSMKTLAFSSRCFTNKCHFTFRTKIFFPENGSERRYIDTNGFLDIVKMALLFCKNSFHSFLTISVVRSTSVALLIPKYIK